MAPTLTPDIVDELPYTSVGEMLEVEPWIPLWGIDSSGRAWSLGIHEGCIYKTHSPRLAQ